METKSFKDLIAWQISMKLVTNAYDLVKKLPKEEMFGLSPQMRRAAVSIPSNIAEGYGRCSDKELEHFLNIAYGSAVELETQIIIANRLNYFSVDEIQSVLEQIDEAKKVIIGLKKSIKNKSKV